jgi:hypothetical protein
LIVNNICEISVQISSDGVRSHNETLRQQLVMLGILKEKKVEIDEIIPLISSLALKSLSTKLGIYVCVYIHIHVYMYIYIYIYI